MKKIAVILLVPICIFVLTGCQTDSVLFAGKDADAESAVIYEEGQGERPDIKIDENVVRSKTGPEPVVYDENRLLDFSEENNGGYYFRALNDTGQRVYKEIWFSVTNREEAVVSTQDQNVLDLAYQCVMHDHPEIFYSSGYVCTKHTKNDELVNLSFYAKYDLEPEETENRQKLIDAYQARCFGMMPKGLDEYGQVRYVYDYIIEHTQYDPDVADNQNICSVFIDGASVCQGYAEAMQYLLKKLGYEITLVSGKTEGGSHAWNLVMVDGDYYYLDTTWGDVDYQTQENHTEPLWEMPVNYDYFLITTSQLEMTHVIDPLVAMPECVATADNYYVREDLYFEQMDQEKIARCFQGAKQRGESAVMFKASDGGVFRALKEYLLEEQRIFEYVDSSDTVSYYEDERMYTICFWLKR